MTSQKVFELQTKPGVRRDGTDFENPFFTDGVWVRWQRRRPRKMGGYRAISQRVAGPVRGMHVDGRRGFVRAHVMSALAIEQLTFDMNGIGSGLIDRTPVGFAPNAAYTWQADSMYESSGVGAPRLICSATPDLLAIDSDESGYVFSGDITGSGALSPVEDSSGILRISGGCCVLQPFLFVYGSNGLIRNSNANDFSSSTGWATGGSSAANEVNVAGTKIVAGLPIRGGGNSPSGLFLALDALVRVSFVGGTQLWSYDTVSAQTTVLGKNSFIEYDGLYYWVGVDRFFFYNGVVQELPNDMNLNWFFDNVNQAHRNKIWALKVPRYGEIWWFFPFGDSTECDHAVIYNVREKTWYDAALVRSAGASARTFPRPLLAGREDPVISRRYLYTPGTGSFGVGDTLAGETSGAYGTVVRVSSGAVNFVNVVGDFEVGETLAVVTLGPGDVYWNNVVLLTQGGTNGSTTIVDQSTYADSVAINNYASFDSGHQVFGDNTIKGVTVNAGVDGFTSSGASSRFGRATGDKFTIEIHYRFHVLENYAPSSMMFAWGSGSGRILEIGTYSTNKLRIRFGDDASNDNVATLSADTDYFIQVNIDGSSVTIDLDGTEVLSGSNLYSIDYAGDYAVYVAGADASGNSAGATSEHWTTPLRMTKGVLRARGAVPTSAWSVGDGQVPIVEEGAANGVLTSIGEEQELTSAWQHEIGVDRVEGQSIVAIESSYETRNFSLLDGGPTSDGAQGDGLQTRISRLEPDFILSGELQVTVNGRSFPNSEVVASEPFVIDADTKFLSLREQRRSMSLKFRSNEIGGDYQEGKIMISLDTGDERG